MSDTKSNKKREAILKAIHFERPDYIPMSFGINGACFDVYPQAALFDLMEEHPFLFSDFVRPELPYDPQHGEMVRSDQPFVDDWGCRWGTTMNGIGGTVTGHPLKDWSDFDNYKVPDPRTCMGVGKIDWEEEKKKILHLKETGNLTGGGLRHNHTFLQVCDLRGYENVLFDMQDEEPLLRVLLDKIVEFNSYIIQQYVDMDVDIIGFGEDLGMQNGPMLSPANFAEYILPCYERTLRAVKEKGIPISMHSDGDIRTLVPYLMDFGMAVLNLQDLVNGIDWIHDNMKGKVCIDLDVDRQLITPFGTPKEIDQLVLDEVKRLGSKEGGLMMTYGLYPGVPLENVKALMDAMEKYAFYYS